MANESVGCRGKSKGLSRVERVIAFLEFLPITKGIKIGTKLKLLPGQRRFIERCLWLDRGAAGGAFGAARQRQDRAGCGPGAVSFARAGSRGARRVLFVRGRPAASRR